MAEWEEWENRRPVGRARTTLIGGHFPPETAQRLAVIAAVERTTKKALLQEALDLLFAKRARTDDAPPAKADDKPDKKQKKRKKEKKQKKKRDAIIV